MALEFQPPPAWLMQEYANRKTPGQEIMSGVGQVAQTMIQQKNMKAKQQNDSLDTYIAAYKAGGPRLAAAVATKIGLKNPPMMGGAPGGTVPPATSTGTAPSPMPGMPGSTPVEDASQMSMPSEHPEMPQAGGAQASPIIAHWNQTMGHGPTPAAGNAPVPPPAPPMAGAPQPGPTLPGSPNLEDLVTGGDWGHSELTARESAQKIQDSQDAHREKTGKKMGVTDDDILKNGFDPVTQMRVNPKDTSAADARHEERMSRAVTDYAKQIETHPIIKKLQDQALGIHSVEDMLQLVGKGNTVASSAMGMKMARAMGEVGVITEQDVKRYVQSRKLTQAAGDKLMGWTRGVPSDATQDEIREIAGYLQDRYKSDAQPIYNRYIERFARAYKTTPEDAAYQLNFPYEPHSADSSSMGGSVPQVGQNFGGMKVLKVTETTKAAKPK